jgi:outer membrane protein, multidrug efflux system
MNRRAAPLVAVAFAASALVSTSSALAQRRPTTPPPAPLTTPAPPAPPPVTIPPAPKVDDPMLAPMPAAAKNVATWQEALDLVRARSTDLRIAYLDVTRAEAQSRVALAGALPSLNGNAAYTRQIITRTVPNPLTGGDVTVPTPNAVTGSLTLAQPLFAPRAWYAIGTAHRAEEVAQLGVEDTKRLIALAVANSLLSVVTAERIAELNRSGFRNALERHDLTRRKQGLGVATGLDVIRAQQDVETARSTIVSGDESLRQAREALGLALGLPQQVGVAPTISLDGLLEAAQGVCKPAKSLDERADIARASRNVEVTARSITDVKYQFSPTVGLGSTLAATTNDTGATPNPTWNIQAILSVPIWEGGARYGFLRNARAATEQAEQQLIALRRNAEVQLAQARRGVKVAEDSRKVAADARALTAETDRLVRAGYIEGQGTSLELVIAASALRQAEIALAIQDFEVVRARLLAVLALANCPW